MKMMSCEIGWSIYDLSYKKMKRQNDSDESEDEIFSYHNKETLTFSHSHRPPTKKANVMDSSSDESEESDDEDDESSSSSSEDENVEVVNKKISVQEIDDDDDLPSPPSPPSPPPPPPVDVTPIVRKNDNSLLSRLRESISVAASPDTPVIDLSTPIEDEKINIKVRIHGLINRFVIYKNKPMECLFDMISTNENADKKNISLSLKNVNISYTDTPESLKLNIASILECVILEDLVVNEEVDLITLKIQTSNKNTRTEFQVGQNSTLSNVLKEFCEKHGHQFEKCVFEFDAETFEPTVTPTDIGLEDGDIIDVIT